MYRNIVKILLTFMFLNGVLCMHTVPLSAQNRQNRIHTQRIIPFSFDQIKSFGGAYLITKEGKKGLYSYT